jgi:hypothetical protein
VKDRQKKPKAAIVVDGILSYKRSKWLKEKKYVTEMTSGE